MKRNYIYVALLAMAVAACTKEEGVEVTQQEAITSVTAEIIQPKTSSRVIIGEYDSNTNSYPLKWSAAKGGNDWEADKINIFDKDGKMSTLFYEGEKSNTIGKFVYMDEYSSGEKITNIDHALANTNIAYDEYFMFNEGNEWEAADPDAVIDVPLYGTMDEATKSLKFYQVTGLLQLNLKGNFEAEDKIFITCEDNHFISGTANVVADKTKPQDAKLVIEDPEGARNTFVSSLKLGAGAKTALVYLPLPVGEYDFLKISLVRKKEAGSVTQTLSSDVTIHHKTAGTKINIEKKLYPFSVTFGELKGPDPANGENTGWDREDNWGDSSSDITIE